MPTDIGYKLIEQARIVLASTQRIKEIINEEKQEVAGSLKIGIIPTLVLIYYRYSSGIIFVVIPGYRWKWKN